MLSAVPQRFNLAHYCLAENARFHPEKIGLTVVGDEHVQRWSYAQLDLKVRQLAAGFKTLNLKPGSHIMIRMGNEANAALAYFAAIAAGYVAFLASAQLTFDEAAFLLHDSEAQALILGASFSHENHVSPGVAILSPQALDVLFLSEPIADYEDTAAQDPAYLVYTSGTTSRPKGVLHAHRAAWGRRPMLTHWTGLRSEDVMLHAGAINWTYTLGVGVVDPLSVGAAAVLYNGKSDPSVWPRLIEHYGVSVFAAVPGVFRQILKYGALEEYDLSSLRHGLSAGAALPQNLSLDWRKRTGKEIFEAFGMSEISTFISSGPLTPIKTDSPGRAQPGRVVAALPVESGDVPLGSGQTGLLAIRRDDPGMMLGYWKRQEEEQQAFRGEWFVSGDLVEFDEDGYMWRHGRADEVMNAGGFRVSPAEVEKCLLTFPNVAEAAVAERAGRDGETTIIKAYVVMREAAPVDEIAILAHCQSHLAAYKRPKVVVFLESLPRNANGKLKRDALA
jgi:acyl-coenzyme A synthetase/AMP-(fatty) acid ligase